MEQDSRSQEANSKQYEQLLKLVRDQSLYTKGSSYNGLYSKLDDILATLQCTLDDSVSKPAFKVRDRYIFFPDGGFVRIAIMYVGLEALVKKLNSRPGNRQNIDKDPGGKIEKLLAEHIYKGADKNLIVNFMNELAKIMSQSYKKDLQVRKVKKQGVTYDHLAHFALLKVFSEVIDKAYKRGANPFNNTQELIAAFKQQVCVFLAVQLDDSLTEEAQQLIIIANSIFSSLIKVLDSTQYKIAGCAITLAEVNKAKAEMLNVEQVNSYRQGVDNLLESIIAQLRAKIDQDQGLMERMEHVVDVKQGFFKKKSTEKTHVAAIAIGMYILERVLSDIDKVLKEFKDHSYIRQLCLIDILLTSAKDDSLSKGLTADRSGDGINYLSCLSNLVQEGLKEYKLVESANEGYKQQFEEKVLMLKKENQTSNGKLQELSASIDQQLDSGINPFKDFDGINDLLRECHLNISEHRCPKPPGSGL